MALFHPKAGVKQSCLRRLGTPEHPALPKRFAQWPPAPSAYGTSRPSFEPFIGLSAAPAATRRIDPGFLLGASFPNRASAPSLTDASPVHWIARRTVPSRMPRHSSGDP
jgi:hypothetical protein